MPYLYHSYTTPGAQSGDPNLVSKNAWNARLRYGNAAGSGPSTTDASLRESLTAVRTYYVRKDGSNSNDGLTNTAGGAFLTITYALYIVRNFIDARGFEVIVQVGPGTYTEGTVDLPVVVGNVPGGIGNLILQGDINTPSNVVLDGTTLRSLGPSNQWYVTGFKLQNPAALDGGVCVWGHAQGWIRMGFVTFGAASVGHILADYGGVVEMMNNYTIAGGAICHAFAQHNGYVVILSTGITVTVTGTPAFSTAFVYSTVNGLHEWAAVTFSGSATGPRYFVNLGSGIYTNTGNANFFPGNAPGTADATTFGWYF